MASTREVHADWSATSPAELMESHLAGPRNTARCYATDLATFAEFLKVKSSVDAVAGFVSLPRGAAERTVHNYLAWLRERYPALNTIRRKAQSVMGLLRRAHRFGVIAWAMDPLKLPAPPPLRDTRGPKREKVLAMIDACQERADAKGTRDESMLTLMAYGAYRCNEVLSLDLRHLDIRAKEIDVLAKGLWGRTTYPVPDVAIDALKRWLEFRGVEDGPLFTANQNGGRLTYWGAYESVKALGRKVGIHCTPHKLRHFAATEYLALTNGNVPRAMALTRHRDPRTILIYNDERLTYAREAMELVASGTPCYRLNR